MANLLNQASDGWSFDKLIQPLSNPGSLEELLSYLNGKHKSYQHDHIDPVALCRVLIAIKFVSSKKKLLNTLKPSIDELINLCYDILESLRSQRKLNESSPWLWLRTILIFINDENNNNNNTKSYPYININELSETLNESLQIHTNNNNQLPQFLFPEWCFATKPGMKIFDNHFKKTMNNLNNNIDIDIDDESDPDSDDDDLFGDNDKNKKMYIDKKKEKEKEKEKESENELIIKPTSTTLSNVSFLSFPRPNPPTTSRISSSSSSAAFNCIVQMRKRQKLSTSSYSSIGSNETDRRRKFSAINDKLNAMMNKKNGQKNTIRLLSIQQKRQMREDSDRREQERKYLIEQTRLKQEKLKKLEQEKQEREEKEKKQLSLINDINHEQNHQFDDFDKFMDGLGGLDGLDGLDDIKMSDDDGPKPLTLEVVNDNNNNTNNNNTDNNNTDNTDNKAAASSSDDESLADMLIVPGSDIPNKPNKAKKENVINDNINDEESRLIGMGIPKQLHKFKWLHTNCNQLTQEDREKIVKFLTGKFMKDGVEKEDILLNRTVDSEKGVTKDSVFRMFFATKKWKKVVLSRRVKKKST